MLPSRQKLNDVNVPNAIRPNKGVGVSFVPISGTWTHLRSRRMIVSFRDDWLRTFFVEDTRSRHVPSDLESRLSASSR